MASKPRSFEFDRGPLLAILFDQESGLDPQEALFMKSIFLFAAIVAGNFAFGQSSTLPEPKRADSMAEQKPSIGIRTGVANVEGSDEQAWEYGIEAGYQPYVPISIAVELSGYAQESDGPDAGMTRTKLLGKGMYNFGGTTPVIRHSYVGAGVGPVYDNLNNEQDLNIGLAPLAGFDIPLAKKPSEYLSLGASVAYLIVTGNNADAFSANGALKYWF